MQRKLTKCRQSWPNGHSHLSPYEHRQQGKAEMRHSCLKHLKKETRYAPVKAREESASISFHSLSLNTSKTRCTLKNEIGMNLGNQLLRPLTCWPPMTKDGFRAGIWVDTLLRGLLRSLGAPEANFQEAWAPSAKLPSEPSTFWESILVPSSVLREQAHKQLKRRTLTICISCACALADSSNMESLQDEMSRVFWHISRPSAHIFTLKVTNGHPHASCSWCSINLSHTLRA